MQCRMCVRCGQVPPRSVLILCITPSTRAEICALTSAWALASAFASSSSAASLDRSSLRAVTSRCKVSLRWPDSDARTMATSKELSASSKRSKASSILDPSDITDPPLTSPNVLPVRNLKHLGGFFQALIWAKWAFLDRFLRSWAHFCQLWSASHCTYMPQIIRRHYPPIDSVGH